MLFADDRLPLHKPIEYADHGEEEEVRAALELLRRKRNRLEKRAEKQDLEQAA